MDVYKDIDKIFEKLDSLSYQEQRDKIKDLTRYLNRTDKGDLNPLLRKLDISKTDTDFEKFLTKFKES